MPILRHRLQRERRQQGALVVLLRDRHHLAGSATQADTAITSASRMMSRVLFSAPSRRVQSTRCNRSDVRRAACIRNHRPAAPHTAARTAPARRRPRPIGCRQTAPACGGLRRFCWTQSHQGDNLGSSDQRANACHCLASPFHVTQEDDFHE